MYICIFIYMYVCKYVCMYIYVGLDLRNEKSYAILRIHLKSDSQSAKSDSLCHNNLANHLAEVTHTFLAFSISIT